MIFGGLAVASERAWCCRTHQFASQFTGPWYCIQISNLYWVSELKSNSDDWTLFPAYCSKHVFSIMIFIFSKSLRCSHLGSPRSCCVC